MEEIASVTIKQPGNIKPQSEKNRKALTKEDNQNSKLLNSYASRGDLVSPVEAKRSREKVEDVYEKE